MFSSQPLVRNEDGKHPRLPGMKQTLLLQHMMRFRNPLHFQEVRHFHHIHGKKPSITIIVFYWCFQFLRAWARTHGTPHLWAFQGCAKCFSSCWRLGVTSSTHGIRPNSIIGLSRLPTHHSKYRKHTSATGSTEAATRWQHRIGQQNLAWQQASWAKFTVYRPLD